MPCLQLDLARPLDEAQRRDLAGRIAATFARLMDTDQNRITVVFRNLGAGGVLRCLADGPIEAVVAHCDIRRGRGPAERAAFAAALTALLVAALDVTARQVVVEFTEHAGDEIYRDGRPADDWQPTARAP